MTDAPDIIKRLVETFDRNIESYRSAEYNEAQLCAEFLLPMFRALGWDVQVHKRRDHCLNCLSRELRFAWDWFPTFRVGNPDSNGYLKRYDL